MAEIGFWIFYGALGRSSSISSCYVRPLKPLLRIHEGRLLLRVTRCDAKAERGCVDLEAFFSIRGIVFGAKNLLIQYCWIVIAFYPSQVAESALATSRAFPGLELLLKHERGSLSRQRRTASKLWDKNLSLSSIHASRDNFVAKLKVVAGKNVFRGN